jgi:hypothetical protein
LFLRQGGDAPAANNSLRHFFVTPPTIVTILDQTIWRLHGRVIVSVL